MPFNHHHLDLKILAWTMSRIHALLHIFITHFGQSWHCGMFVVYSPHGDLVTWQPHNPNSMRCLNCDFSSSITARRSGWVDAFIACLFCSMGLTITLIIELFERKSCMGELRTQNRERARVFGTGWNCEWNVLCISYGCVSCTQLPRPRSVAIFTWEN